MSLGEAHADSGALQHHSGASTAIVDHRRHGTVRVNIVDVPLPLVIARRVRIVRHQLVVFFCAKLCQYMAYMIMPDVNSKNVQEK